MSTSEHSEVTDFIDRVWQSMGGRGTQPEVTQHVIASRPEHLTNYLADKGTASAVGAYLRRKDGESGLPAAPAVDEHGTHAQLELLSVEEFRYVVASYRKRSRDNDAMADRANERCHEVHGVWAEKPKRKRGAA